MIDYMEKQEKQVEITKTIDDFEIDTHLWNIFTGGSGKSLIMLKKIVDAIQWQKVDKMPSILLYGGEGRTLLAKALINSLVIEDLREVDSRYFDCGIPSEFFFEDSLYGTAHLITNIQNIRGTFESNLWQYLKFGRCRYDHYAKGTSYIHCNGLIVLTSLTLEIPKQILDAVDYKIEVEPFNNSQLELVILQRLKYCGIGYSEDEAILKKIVEVGKSLKNTMALLKTAITIMNSEGRNGLTLKDIDMAAKLS